MTPDEVIILLNTLKHLEDSVRMEQALSSAISFIQDYQKLRERMKGIEGVLNEILAPEINPFNNKVIAEEIITHLNRSKS